VYLTGTMDARRFDDSVAGIQTSSRRTQSLSGGLQGDRFFPAAGRLLSYSATLIGGRLDRGGVPADLAADEATRRTQGGYRVVRATAGWQEQLSPNFSLSATGIAQLAGKNLDSSEKIYLGGPRGVRAYPVEEGGSDEGQIVNLEARWRFTQDREGAGGEWTLVSFFDAGRAVLNKSVWAGWNSGNPGLRNEYMLKGWGLGVRAQLGRTAQIEFVAASTLGANPGASAAGLNADGRAARARVWLYGTLFF
jgi:hemolysin activation/secretion protein